ncbi:MAG: hypothetical protein HY000_23305, partial [Planctomycetes bacterium]|nr:hypothetical protein [Planctomycetota bacterium]
GEGPGGGAAQRPPSALPITNYDQARGCDTAAFARFFWAMLQRGVYLPCSQFEAWFLSAAHREENLERTIRTAGEALAETARSGPKR